MEQSRKEMWNSVMTHGAVLGGVLVVYSFILYLMDAMYQNGLGLVNYIITIGLLVVFASRYRDRHLGGFITFGKAWGYSVKVVFFSSIIVSFFSFLLYKVIDPASYEQMWTLLEESYLESGQFTEDEVESLVDMGRVIMTPARMAIWSVFVYTFFGGLLALIPARIVRRNPDPFSHDMLDVES